MKSSSAGVGTGSRDNEILEVLREVRSALKILASEKRDELLKELEAKSPKRRQMFRLFDGKRTLAEIAKRAKTSAQAVQQFAKECHAKGLIEYVKPSGGGRRRPKRIG